MSQKTPSTQDDSVKARAHRQEHSRTEKLAGELRRGLMETIASQIRNMVSGIGRSAARNLIQAIIRGISRRF